MRGDGNSSQELTRATVEPTSLFDAYLIGAWTEYIRMAKPEDLVVLPSGAVHDQKGNGYILHTLYLIQDFLRRKGLDYIVQYS
ncbi:hypothetical protein [Thermococcus sp.]|uniref:hypothetical protein n=1 Tax=Thermococcus sp. TaxID=35749 RepID=UPI00262BC2E0|nr:hypothetical protein [Thermococcus sp.]